MLLIHLLELLFAVFGTLLVGNFAWITLKLGKTKWLNRCFALYGIFLGVGFIFYGIYHLLLQNSPMIITIMILSHIMYNTGFIFLLLSVFIVEYVSISLIPKKVWIFLLFSWIVSWIMYPIIPPTLDEEKFEMVIVDTVTPLPTFLVVNLFRIAVIIFTTLEFHKFIRFTSNRNSKRKFRYFKAGNILFISGIFLNFLGGITINLFEIIGLGLVVLTFILYIIGFTQDNKTQLQEKEVLIRQLREIED